jgi:hypothetical protein
MTNTTDERAVSQARSQLDTICELVAVYRSVNEKGDDDSGALQQIYQNGLAVSVRSNWQEPGSRFEPSEYQVLLCWGGPSCRIIGDLAGGDPVTARLEYQDWFTPWEELQISATETETLIDFARFFYFGN